MKWNELETQRCPVARTLSVIGDRWTILILRDAMRGASRFDDFHGRLKCSRAIVSDRLSGLVERGVLVREQYEAHPPRFDYRLTEMGRSLAPVLMTMSQWAETWMPLPGVPRIERIHLTCGHAFQPALHCSECGEKIGPGEIKHIDPMQTRAPGI
jgi:DNA-binding HxlR family transcriptional regulator